MRHEWLDEEQVVRDFVSNEPASLTFKGSPSSLAREVLRIAATNRVLENRVFEIDAAYAALDKQNRRLREVMQSALSELWQHRPSAAKRIERLLK